MRSRIGGRLAAGPAAQRRLGAPGAPAGGHDDEGGSAAGTLKAIQQLGNSIGVALLATIFFSLLGHGHASPAAMARTVLLVAALLVVAFALSFPAAARGADGRGLARGGGVPEQPLDEDAVLPLA